KDFGPVLSGRLGAVERNVGIAQQFFWGRPLARGDPDAGRAGQGDVTADDLVATEASDGVTLAQHTGQSGPHPGQELVTGPMTQRVIDVLEVVEVEEERS